MGSLNPVKGNPNALVGLGGGVGGAQIVLNLARIWGWHISPGWATGIAGAATYVVLYIGREGLAGVWHGLMHGFNNQPKGTP